MAGPVACRASRLPTSYSGSSLTRLRLRTLAVLLGLGVACSGCAVSNPFGGMFGREKDDARAYAAKVETETTGSIPAPAAEQPKAAPSQPSEADLSYARAAVAEVLARGAKTMSAPWENPKTGARGSVTAIASAYTQEGRTCHDFLASYVLAGSEAWMQGSACREKKGRWEVKTMRPWKRS